MIDAALPPTPRLRFRRTRRPILVPTLAGIAILATLVTNPLRPVVLFNATPSEPPGLYAASLAPDPRRPNGRLQGAGGGLSLRRP